MRPEVVVTPGDPRGIGPEVTRDALDAIAKKGPDASIRVFGPDGELDPDVLRSLPRPFDQERATSAEAGAFAAGAIERAVEEAMAGRAHAVVTGPLHKPSLQAAGYDHPGQTELLGELTGSAEVGMLMAAERLASGSALRVLLATTHMALRDVPSRLTTELLVRQSLLLLEALRTDWGIAEPRMALCAFNPHASDGGLFGDEEEVVYGPAIERLLEAGSCVTGPLPADTVFTRALRGDFDAVLAPYHDVGMAGFKTAAFGRGVNVTLGLPFVRTSPDHGTAFDLAGSGSADPSSMVEAIVLGATLASKRFDMDSGDV